MRHSAVGAAVAAMVFTASGGASSHADEFTASTLSRSDSPVVVTGETAAGLLGAVPGDVVGFRWDRGAWEQVPVQVDERHVTNIRNAYPTPMSSPCADPCYTPGDRRVDQLVYSDPNTLIGGDPDQTLDDDDEVAFMAKDTGGQTDDAGLPDGVRGEGTEITIHDPVDDGVGYLYLFERDANAAQPLDPAAGRAYVTYRWEVAHIQDAHPGDVDGTADHYRQEYRFNGHDGTAYVGNPERSWVETAHYRREMTGRYTDNGMIIKRGVAPEHQVDILERHDASITLDIGGIRNQNTFDVGEMAYLTSKAGPIRAIRDFVGTNSGPLTQRRHIFYESSEEIRIDVRVHAIPSGSDIWNYNDNAIGMRSATSSGSDRIDGQPSGYAGVPVVLPDSWNWETVDRDTPDDPARGGLTHVVHYDSNNFPPTAHLVYRDGGDGGSPSAPYRGSSHSQGPLVVWDTDATSAGPNRNYLHIERTVHYEETGTADGPRRLGYATNPLEVTSATR